MILIPLMGPAQEIPLEVDSAGLCVFYFREGNSQVLLRDFTRATHAYRMALNHTSDVAWSSLIHQNLGCVFFLEGEYEKAAAHFTHAFRQAQKTEIVSQNRMAELALNIGACWYEMQRPEKAAELWATAGSLQTGQSWLARARIQMAIGSLLVRKKEFRRALERYRLILEEMPAGADVTGEEIWILKNAALCYENLGLPDSALSQLDMAVGRIGTTGITRTSELPEIYIVRGNIARKYCRYDLSIESFTSGLESLPAEKDPRRILFTREILKTRFYQVSAAGSGKEVLQDLLANILPLIYLPDCRDLCGIAMEMLYRIGIKHPEEIRQFLQISDRIKTWQNQAITIKPASGLVEKQLFWFHRQRFSPDSVSSAGATAREELEVRLWDQMDSIMGSTTQQVTKNNPEDSRFPDLASLQKELNSGEAVLDLTVVDSILFSVFISRDTIIILRSIIDVDFREAIGGFERGLKRSDETSFSVHSRYLYERLIAPFKMPVDHQVRLWIIPDGFLRFLPFETLISPDVAGQDSCRQPHFLIRDTEIAYSVSCSSWYRNRTCMTGESPEYEIDFLACAPGFSGTGRFAQLNYAGLEADQLLRLFQQSHFRTAKLNSSNIEEEEFLELATKSRWVHLASHAYRNQDHPEFSGWLLISDPAPSPEPGEPDGKLEIGELQRLRMPADLLVLSTCSVGETTSSSWYRMTGFPEVFLHAGVRNILFSLWDVSDKHTFRVMMDFYRGIIAGDCYAAALRKAKLQMLATPQTASPALWAPFVLYTR